MSPQIHLPRLSPQEGKFPERIDCNELLKCAGKRVALDTETTGLRWWINRAIGLGVWCPDAQVSGYIPIQSEETYKEVVATLLKFPPGTKTIFHNAKFDLHFLGINPVQTGWQVIDTMVLVHLLDSRDRKSLAAASKKYLGDASKGTYKHKIPKKYKRQVWKWPIETIAEYCVNDCRLTYLLAKELIPLTKEEDLFELFLKEMKYLGVIWEIERHGIGVDIEFAKQGIARFLRDQNSAAKTLFDAIGYEFNWQSPQQLSKALYDDMGVARPTAADIGQRKQTRTQTDSFILEKIGHPLSNLVSHLRETQKMLNYLQNAKKDTGYLNLMDTHNILHQSLNLTGARTGRLAGSNPNLQQVTNPIRHREIDALYGDDTTHRIEEYNLRKALIPTRPGDILLCIDWKQMELRFFALLAQENKMMEMLARGEDIHGTVAEMVWGSRDSVHRQWAKAIAFGLIYGMSIRTLAFELRITIEEAQEVAQQYWNTFPRMRPWLAEVVQECNTHKLIRYWSKRIWREDNPSHMYKATNAVVSGGCADILSIATLRCAAWIDNHNYHIHMVNLVHDEIVFQLPEEHLFEVVKPLSKIMEVEDLFGIPFYTDAKWGYNWGELEKINDPK